MLRTGHARPWGRGALLSNATVDERRPPPDGTVLLAGPTFMQIGELIQTIFGDFDLRVRLPSTRETPPTRSSAQWTR